MKVNTSAGRPHITRQGGAWTCLGLGIVATAGKPCLALRAWDLRRRLAGWGRIS